MRLALLMLLRDWRAGELRVLAAAIVIAVGAVSGVGFFTNRIELALERQASYLLGADLVLRADHAPPRRFAAEARRLGLQTELTLTFPSMVSHGENHQLAEIKAVGAAYPLRGRLRAAGAAPASAVPAPGTAWADERLMAQLGVKAGDRIEVGQASLSVAAALAEEPDRSGDFFHIAPRLLIHRADVPATGLVQEGSRIAYRLLVAGDETALRSFRQWAQSRLGRGEGLEGLTEARPEVRTALERAQRYLGLAALMSVVLAGVAVALAVRRFVARHLDSCAIMRCLGASQRQILQIYLGHFCLLGLLAGALGVALGFAAHSLLSHWLALLLAPQLPAPGWSPVLVGLGSGFALLFGFVLPPLWQLRQVPTLRVLRRELGAPAAGGWAGFVLAMAVLALLVVRQAGDARLGLAVLAVLALAALLAVLLARLVARAARLMRAGAGIPWRYGIASIGRRAAGSSAQIAAFGLAGMALLALTVVRGDLLDSWLAKIPPQAPNRFVINIQPDQVAELKAFFAANQANAPEFFPMVRGRLVAVNGRAISPDTYADEHARRMVEREFNLSWAASPHAGNLVTAGRWWQADSQDAALFSVEEGIARTLGIRLGDALTYDIAGTPVTARVTSLRQVDWDSFRVNFFVVAPPGLLEAFPASYLTSFYLPPGDSRLVNAMLEHFPNLTLIDVAALVGQVRGLLDKAAYAMQLVFSFMLAAGLTVLYAAISISSDERRLETAIWRTLGARRGQVLAAAFAEFAAIGFLAGLIAAAGATALQYAVGEYVLHLPVRADFRVFLVVPPVLAVLLGTAGTLGVRRLIGASPLSILRRA